MEIIELKNKWETLRKALNPAHIEAEINRLEKRAGEEDFWKDRDKAREISKKLNDLKELKKEIESTEQLFKEIEELKEVAKEDIDLQKELDKEIERLREKIESLELRVILSSPDDVKNCILTIHPGAGGTESQDWADMLLRMYLRYCERKGFRVKADVQPGEEAGIKSATLFIEGNYAYGLLKAERGVHRLVRISPFDASRRRHTSFAAVFVYPEVEEVEVEIKDDELEIETFRASGPGGQHVQKASTAIRIRHIPTGIVVSCQSERSLHQNRVYAMKLLRAKLKELYDRERRKKLKELEKEKTDIAWGNQIRSYILHPYKMVKDHRTGLETGKVDEVLDGNIDEFIRVFLLNSYKEKKEK